MKDNDLLTRAVCDVIPRKLAEDKLKTNKPLRIYLGIDPTGSKLHIGHSVPLRKLQAFQNAGHHVIFLIGSYTAMIGDPTGQDKMRESLTREQVEENFKTYKDQAGKVLDFSKIELRYNHEWFDKMHGAEIMELMSHFTIQQMLQRDMFQERMSWKVICQKCKEKFNSPIQFGSEESFKTAKLEGNTAKCPHCNEMTPCNREDIVPPANPVSPTEFMYPIMQGYDSVMLDVDCELGGNDQLFNMLCGRTLQKDYGKREKFVLTTKLLEGTDGRKMSKTYDNCIYLDDEASDMYGKVMSVNDDLMEQYFECCTDVPMDEVKKILQGNPRDAKARLAREIVTIYHDEKAAANAEEEFLNVFKKGGIPEDMPEVTVKKGAILIDVLVEQKLIASKSEARRLVEQGGIKVNDKPVDSIEATVEDGIVKIGKRKFLKCTIK